MNIQKLISSSLAVSALALVAAGAQAAPGVFNFTTVFSPNPVTTSDPMSNIIVTNGGDNGDSATGIGTQVNLTNFTESSTLADPNAATFSDPVSIAVTITPVDSPGTSITDTFTGLFSGQFNSSKTFTGLTFTSTGVGSAPQTYDFGQGGVYTLSNLGFTPPGATGSRTLGAVSAQVNFKGAPMTSTPEPATVVPFLLGGLGLMTLIVRKSRKTSSVTA